MTSKDKLPLYTENYFLNQVEGYKEFAQGKVSKDREYYSNLIDVKDKTILDIGFGRGDLLQLCYNKNAALCLGIDFSAQAYYIAKNYCNPKILLHNMDLVDIDRLCYDNIDTVFMIDILEHISDDECAEFLRKLKQKISYKCILIIATPLDIRRGDYKGMHFNQWTEDKIISMFSWLFKTICFHRYNGQIVAKCFVNNENE